MQRTGMGWLMGLGFIACNTSSSPSVTPSDGGAPVAATDPTTEPQTEIAGPRATQEPEHPWPVDLLDVPGHAPLPQSAGQSIWLTMNGVGATVTSGEIHKISTLLDGRLETVPEGFVLPELYEVLSVVPDKDTLLIWADQRIPADTVVRALYTGGRAGYRHYAFVVGTPGAREIIPVDPPIFVPGEKAHRGQAWADLELAWTPAGVAATLVARYSSHGPQPRLMATPLDLGGGSCIMPGGTRPDAAVLQRMLDDLCATAGDEAFAVHVALGEGPIGDVLWTLASDHRPASCRLAPIVEAGSGKSSPPCEGALSHADAIAAFSDADQETHVTTEDIRQGSGTGFGGRGTPVPRVRQAKADVSGSLDRDIIRRIVRAHINEVRHCYNEGLETDPGLGGRIAISFTISAQGTVSRAEVQESTMRDGSVGRCTAKAVKRWKFPKPPGGGVVEVVYPFVLSPT